MLRKSAPPKSVLSCGDMNGYDAVDRALLAALAADPRATVVALADRLEMSRNTVQARMSRLEASGAFLSFERSIDPVPLGFPLEAFVVGARAAEAARRRSSTRSPRSPR